MENGKIRAIAKIERDAENYFFLKMLYGDEADINLKTVYEIEDACLIAKLVEMSKNALRIFSIRSFKTIVLYNPVNKWRFHGLDLGNEENKILAGTISASDFDEINYLIHMISDVLKKKDMGSLVVSYEDKIMSEIEFHKFQESLSIYK